MLVKKRRSRGRVVSQERTPTDSGGYDLAFWLAYVSNVLASAAVAMLFRYADFIQVLGGTELELGWIVGVGMVGSLAMRLGMGTSIDRYGTRRVWLVALTVLAASSLAHVAITSCRGVTVYVLRILFSSAMAGLYGASMTFVSRRVPTVRMGELYGMLGTATFVGYLGGALLSDLLFDATQVPRAQVVEMFVGAALLGALAFPFAWIATRGEVRPPCLASPSSWQVLRRYSSSVLILVGIVMGLVVGIPNAFLRTYAAELGIPRIGLFFSVCAVSAVLTRIPTRRWPERLGHRRVILMGLGLMMLSQLAYLWVRVEWQLMVPAVGFGCSQAILFPAVTGAGSASFPAAHRGLATALMLAAADLGVLLGAPAAGVVLRFSDRVHLPPYPTLFVTLAVLLTWTGLGYALAAPRRAILDEASPVASGEPLP